MSTVAPKGAPPRGGSIERRSLAWRVGLGGTLALAMGVGPLTIYALTALSPTITAEFDLSRTQFGALATLSFLVAASTSTAGGRLIDRVGGRQVLLLLFLTSGLALALLTFAGNYAWLLVAVAVSGAAQSLSNPVTNQVVAVSIPTGHRGLLMGAKQSGVQMSQFLAGVSLPAVAAVIGWRGASSSTAVLAVVGVLLVLVVIPSGSGTVTSGRGAGATTPRRLPRDVWWLTVYIALMGAALQATNVYLPLYAFEQVGFGAVLAGATTGVMGAVGLTARVAWGRFADRAAVHHTLLMVLGLASVGAVVALHLASTGVAPLLWVGIALHGAAALASNVVVMLAAMRVLPTGQIGRGTGLVAVGMYLGFAIGPITFGLLADRTGGYAGGWILLATLYLAAAATASLWARRGTAIHHRSRSQEAA